ncbi:tRNA (adenosine(37)-N6)-threonylcarbamoyltransferase complex dimerization subunit type 1 TsaB [Microbacterium karelineae]|uniref:tRNA (adenosine(37)-N6)-threonylcarbamoyltransferase complex dimerization subunit type 1 TsaB n=1 Tax=Microbacterium karelineae TaxID=2654283 RepID=UPI0012E9B047|nr:tRNA (adenosine(37)-N6)-threonylcarbamoyltransferase complex dimerization subunit type 1 TsaB [Microbacterium karelineae]
MILAIDSSLGSSVAVVDPATDEVRAQADSASPRGHAEVIGTLLERALDEAGVAPADITHVAAGMGPGPFTGLRIGIAAARAFATGRGIPVVPVVSHDAAALEHLAGDPTGAFAIVTDARRRENAVSTYSGLDDAGIPVRTGGPDLVPSSETRHIRRDEAESAGSEGISAISPHLGTTTSIAAGAVGILAARSIRAGRIPDIAEPLYLRAPDAKLPGPVKRVST